jgi:hypothetical protein
MIVAPVISFDQAERVGQALHDHWLSMSGAAPLKRDDMGWGDIVQFTLRTARDVLDGDKPEKPE